MRRHKLLAARGKGGWPLPCAGPGLKGSRERASAERLAASRPPCRTPRPDPHRGHRRQPKSPQKAFFALWSNKKYVFYKRSTFRSMFSLESWPEAFEHCKTAAEINHFMLENTSENAVFFGVPAALRGGIAYTSVSGCRRGGLMASLLKIARRFP